MTNRFIPEIWFNLYQQTHSLDDPALFVVNGLLIGPKGKTIDLDEGQDIAFMSRGEDGVWTRIVFTFQGGLLGLNE